MKIAIIRKKYVFHGGAEGFSRELIRRLAAEGHEVHIFASRWENEGAGESVIFHKLHTISINSTLRDITFALSARLALKRKRFDIIQSHDKTLLQDIYRSGDGCHIEWLRQRWRRASIPGKLSIALNPYHWSILTIERMIFKGRRYRKIIAISDLVRKNIMDNYGTPQGDIEVIYNGVDLNRFSPGNRITHRGRIRRELSIGDDDLVGLFVGSGFERKGVGHILKALNLIPGPLVVIIVGKGPELKFDDRHGNKRVIFLGPRKDVEAYYAASDFFVFPAIYEPFGNVHLEALASGLPVITTAATGGAEIIDEGEDGFVVPEAEDVQAIADAITVLMDKDKRDSISLKAREKAELFTFERHIRETLNLYNKLLGDEQP